MEEMQTEVLGPGSLITDRLVVVRSIGSGGTGDVYEVEHKYTRHRRAVKVLRAQFRENADLVERFLREASAAGRIGNPHIIETFDAGYLEDGSPFIVMEFLEGKPLDDVLRRNGRLESGLACAVLVQVCAAVQAAHEANIIHRDLKPENLFLTEREGEAFVKVLDFGISKFQGEDGAAMRSTRTGIAMGTPLYMPPEQLRSAKDVDARCDLYSLGVILYELLVGQTPFSADSFAELTVKILTEEPESPLAFDAALPPALSHIALKAMSKDPAGRYSSAAELGAALQPFAHNSSVSMLLDPEVRTAESPVGVLQTLEGASEPKRRATALPVSLGFPGRAPGGTTPSRPGRHSGPAPAPLEPEPAAPPFRERVHSRLAATTPEPEPAALPAREQLHSRTATAPLEEEPVALPARGRGPVILGALVLVIGLLAGGWGLFHADEAPPPVTPATPASPGEAPARVRTPGRAPPLPEPPPAEVAPPAAAAPDVAEVRPPAPVAGPLENVVRKRVEAAPAPSGPRGVVDLDCRGAACTIELDGRPAGETPKLNLQLEAGSHVAVFTNLETRASTTRALNVKAGERLRVSVEW
jgi:serine/threonine-protein kinase